MCVAFTVILLGLTQTPRTDRPSETISSATYQLTALKLPCLPRQDSMSAYHTAYSGGTGTSNLWPTKSKLGPRIPHAETSKANAVRSRIIDQYRAKREEMASKISTTTLTSDGGEDMILYDQKLSSTTTNTEAPFAFHSASRPMAAVLIGLGQTQRVLLFCYDTIGSCDRFSETSRGAGRRKAGSVVHCEHNNTYPEVSLPTGSPLLERVHATGERKGIHARIRQAYEVASSLTSRRRHPIRIVHSFESTQLTSRGRNRRSYPYTPSASSP